MKVLLTGGAGYLGSVTGLILLKSGHEVTVLDRLDFGGQSILGHSLYPEFRFVRGDVRDSHLVEQLIEGQDAVVHLAAIVGDPACARNPAEARSVNLDGSEQLISAASEASVSRFVFASTCSNYGRMRDSSQLATEEYELNPVSLYAETKVDIEHRLLANPGLPLTTTVLRFATLYGVSPRMRFDLTVNEFVMRLLTDRRLTVYGEQFWRPYVHVADAARAIQLVLEAPGEAVHRQVFNVGSTAENYRKLDLVNLLKQRIEPADIDFVKKTEDPRDYRVSFERIKAQLSFEPARLVPQGIDEVARAIQSGLIDNPAHPRYYNVAETATAVGR
jgi:nucleoside-diphosphate-sugar epimerase